MAVCVTGVGDVRVLDMAVCVTGVGDVRVLDMIMHFDKKHSTSDFWK